MASVQSNKINILKKITILETALECKVCTKLLNDPVLIPKCGHSTCKACFTRHRDNTCPVCKFPLATKDCLEDKQLRELLQQLLKLREVLERDPPPPSSTPKQTRTRASSCKAPCTPLASQQQPPPSLARKSSGSSPHPNKKNHKGETLLHRMVIKGDISRVRELLKEGADVNTQDHNGWTPLHEASNHGLLEMASLLLDHGALVNVPSSKDLVTPLHDALLNGYQMDMATLLVSRGADPHVKTSFNKSALELCRTEEDERILKEACSPLIEGSTISTIEVAASHQQTDKLVFLSSNLDDAQKVQLQQCAALLSADVVEEFGTEVSHIVTSCDAEGNCMRTMKILLGMLTGKWVMNYQWVEVCLEYKQKVTEEVFEAQGTKNQPNTQGPRRARHNVEQRLPTLFSGLHFYLHSNFKAPTPNREELCNLIDLGGGRILSREPRPNHCMTNEEPVISSYHADEAASLPPNIILYQDKPPRDTHVNEGGVCTTQVMWLVACISQFKLLSPQQTGIAEK